ncbi:hypothetical protein A2738_02260 [Candidatus Nomurabacteria bacterium RIFCSPHIGHO2_01_FULL_42_15]|uniref:PilN domain-containing protein n=1 Tax=Candidatus Nomurabacteria bacterium RIFCSPHIGHO2_01_FULL_42_15 TaxID=1801742 RepID=A0A1F6VF32_9BACT|nr:MAG: hypothetical protein A2738_02260 [Candidatus Nomurabacteria bacterium RIFCSPHIGHO2_01_FULL_42_15]OGI93424.1 MAG: hypothetical protein A3A99_01990 [Candidatus Nomurabacteria bacterium RIFCSPLOWO2_01_FULL_41_18]
MEPNFQTSFIPKKPIVEEHAVAGRSIGFFTIISIFVLFTVLLATGGLFFYKGILKKTIVEKEKSLTLAKEDFEPAKILQLQTLEKRLNAANEILTGHIAITPVFQALSAITMKTVRFTKFTYGLEDIKDSKVNIKMAGVAVGYRSIALQSDLFTTRDEGKNFIDPVFSNLALDDKGNVLFDLEFSVNPAFVDYKTTLNTDIDTEEEGGEEDAS